VKNLLVFAPNRTDATSLYRSHGPLYALRRRMADLQVVEGTTATWVEMKMADAVFLQRPANDSHVALINLARVNHVPTWVDYDDDLYCVPFSNPTHANYNRQKTQNNVTTILAKADLVTVSTPAIANRFLAILSELEKSKDREPDWVLNPGKVVLLPNAYDTELLSKLEPRTTVPHKLICWRGSSTHDADLMTHAEPFCKAFGKHLDWTINMLGAPFWGFIEAIDAIPGIRPTNNVITESLDPINFFDFLRTIGPALMIVPLQDNAFNRAKSNIVWLEGLHAGAVTLAPDWDEWRRPGIINYKDPADFGVKLDAFLSGKYDAAKLWWEGAQFVGENLTIGRVNRLREVLLRDLMERR
jgi:hypothetical protein